MNNPENPDKVYPIRELYTRMRDEGFSPEEVTALQSTMVTSAINFHDWVSTLKIAGVIYYTGDRMFVRED